MRIMLAMHRIMDYGGIINFVEDLAYGLQELGHQPRLRMLTWKPYSPRGSDRGTEDSIFGLKFDQRNGWVWKPKNIICYGGQDGMEDWHRIASSFDAIIWVVPVPSANAQSKGNDVWPELYETYTPQVAVIHDGNLRDGYPWLAKIADRLKAAVGVHPCAYNSLEGFNVNRALAFNPQRNIKERLNNTPHHQRPKGWMSLQTFKGWKRVPQLVSAVPHMENYTKTLIGTGIDYHYLTSVQKCKYPGVWLKALRAGMDHRSIATNAERESMAAKHRVLIDPSWSKKYAALGSHFNRVVVDAIIAGMVPVGTDLGMAPGLPNDVFRPGVDFIQVPHDAYPKVYANIVDYAVNLDPSFATEMVENGRSHLPKFEPAYVASQYISLLRKPRKEPFFTDGNFDDRSNLMFNKHFAAKESL